VARDFESSLAAAREAYQRNDPLGALKKLDQARSAAAKSKNEDQLRHVLDFADGVIVRDEHTEIERESLLYAVRQNLRRLTRRRALLAGQPWEDPFPDLTAPEGHTRTYITRGVRFWIALAIAFGTLVVASFIAAFVAGLFDSGPPALALRIRNDTGSDVTLKWCDRADCDGDLDPRSTTQVDSGQSARRDLPAADVVDLFVVEDGDGGRIGCLPVRVDRVYQTLPSKRDVTVVRVSEATPCPGEIVEPRLVSSS
jgi:hypothetical protein